MKDKINAILNEKYSTLSLQRKQTIVASLLQAEIKDDTLLNEMISRLAAHVPESILGYSKDLLHCERCRNRYEDVLLYNGRQANYCAKCRICVPKAIRNV